MKQKALDKKKKSLIDCAGTWTSPDLEERLKEVKNTRSGNVTRLLQDRIDFLEDKLTAIENTKKEAEKFAKGCSVEALRERVVCLETYNKLVVFDVVHRIQKEIDKEIERYEKDSKIRSSHLSSVQNILNTILFGN